jgi:hypothetical protein
MSRPEIESEPGKVLRAFVAPEIIFIVGLMIRNRFFVRSCSASNILSCDFFDLMMIGGMFGPVKYGFQLGRKSARSQRAYTGRWYLRIAAPGDAESRLVGLAAIRSVEGWTGARAAPASADADFCKP